MVLTSRRIGDNVTDSEPLSFRSAERSTVPGLLSQRGSPFSMLDPAQETVEKVIFELPEGVKSVCGNQTWHLPVDLMGENSAP